MTQKDVRARIEGTWSRLEAIEHVAGLPSFLVATFRVDYRERPSFNKTPPRVVKLSKKEYATTEARLIKLGSSRYYREYNMGTAGVADPEEARFRQEGSLRDLSKVYCMDSKLGSMDASIKVTWRVRDFLMFCTSVMPIGGSIRRLRRQFPDYDYATVISDPSAFAMQLGKDIGAQFNMDSVSLNGMDRLRQMLLGDAKMTKSVQRGVDTAILVKHGPVIYTDSPETIINRIPNEWHGEVVPFMKRRIFKEQQEYRFVIYLVGEPKQMEFYMEITDELRSLTCPYLER